MVLETQAQLAMLEAWEAMTILVMEETSHDHSVYGVSLDGSNEFGIDGG